MSAALPFRVGDLAPDERVGLRCACHVRVFRRAQLIWLVGRHARLDHLELYPELACAGCGEISERGWIIRPPRPPAWLLDDPERPAEVVLEEARAWGGG